MLCKLFPVWQPCAHEGEQPLLSTLTAGGLGVLPWQRDSKMLPVTQRCTLRDASLFCPLQELKGWMMN